MRKVIWSKRDTSGNLIAKGGVWYRKMIEQGEAMFHRWNTDGTATIELEDGTVKNIPAEYIRFISGEIDN